MDNNDKRLIELWFQNFYLWYTFNNTKHTFKDFFKIPELLQTNIKYDIDLIEKGWLDFLTKTPEVPTDREMALAYLKPSNSIKLCPRRFQPFFKPKYNLRRKAMIQRYTYNMDLNPKIKEAGWHEEILKFAKQFQYIAQGFNNIIPME
jgi:hypothetical protein